MLVRCKVQYLLWLDDWVDIALFGDRESAVACRDTMKLASPVHSFRVVWHNCGKSKVGPGQSRGRGLYGCSNVRSASRTGPNSTTRSRRAGKPGAGTEG